MAATIIVKGVPPRKCPLCKKMTLRYAADVHATEDDHSGEGFGEEITHLWLCTECEHAVQDPDKNRKGEET